MCNGVTEKWLPPQLDAVVGNGEPSEWPAGPSRSCRLLRRLGELNTWRTLPAAGGTRVSLVPLCRTRRRMTAGTDPSFVCSWLALGCGRGWRRRREGWQGRHPGWRRRSPRHLQEAAGWAPRGSRSGGLKPAGTETPSGSARTSPPFWRTQSSVRAASGCENRSILRRDWNLEPLRYCLFHRNFRLKVSH